MTKSNLNYIYFLMVLAALINASAFIVGKYTLPFMGSGSLCLGRYVVATICLGIVKHREDKKNPHKAYKLKKNKVLLFMAMGIIGMTCNNYLFYIGLDNTSVINTSLATATAPVITMIMAFFFLREKLSWFQSLGMAMSLGGILLTITNGNLADILGLNFNKGDTLIIVSMVCSSIYTILSRKFAQDVPPLAITYYCLMFSMIGAIPLAAAEKPWLIFSQLPAMTFVSIIYMGVFVSAVVQLIHQTGIATIGATKTILFHNLIPVFSAVFAVTLLDEELTLLKVSTGVLIVVGVYISQNKRKDKQIEAN